MTLSFTKNVGTVRHTPCVERVLPCASISREGSLPSSPAVVGLFVSSPQQKKVSLLPLLASPNPTVSAVLRAQCTGTMRNGEVMHGSGFALIGMHCEQLARLISLLLPCPPT